MKVLFSQPRTRLLAHLCKNKVLLTVLFSAVTCCAEMIPKNRRKLGEHWQTGRQAQPARELH